MSPPRAPIAMVFAGQGSPNSVPLNHKISGQESYSVLLFDSKGRVQYPQTPPKTLGADASRLRRPGQPAQDL